MPSEWAKKCASAYAPTKYVRPPIYEADGLCLVINTKSGYCAIYSAKPRPGFRTSHMVNGHLREFKSLEHAVSGYMALVAKNKGAANE